MSIEEEEAKTRTPLRSSPDKPVLNETWTLVNELPADSDSDYSEEEVSPSLCERWSQS